MSVLMKMHFNTKLSKDFQQWNSNTATMWLYSNSSCFTSIYNIWHYNPFFIWRNTTYGKPNS